MKTLIYLLPIVAVNDYLKEKNPDKEPEVARVSSLDRYECAEILFRHESKFGHGTPAGVYDPRALQEEFNYALEDKRISSDDYYIRTFQFKRRKGLLGKIFRKKIYA